MTPETKAKLIRYGWIDSNGRSLDWWYWCGRRPVEHVVLELLRQDKNPDARPSWRRAAGDSFRDKLRNATGRVAR